MTTDGQQQFLTNDLEAAHNQARDDRRSRSLANLVKFKPGESGNMVGRPRGVVYVSEYLNRFLKVNEEGISDHPEDILTIIAEDKYAPPPARIAARVVLTAMSDGRRWIKVGVEKLTGRPIVKYAGLDPEVAKATAMIMDRLEGKAVARVDLHTSDEPRTPLELHARMQAMILKHPDLLMRLIKNCPPELRTLLDLAPIAADARELVETGTESADESTSPPSEPRTPL